MDKDTIVIGGDISLVHDTLDGECGLLNQVDGSPGAFYTLMPDSYTGETVFTPTTEEQVVEVKGLSMPQNIIINPIPSNYGLITWDGAILTVS